MQRGCFKCKIQTANHMVGDADARREKAQRLYEEAQLKLEVLNAELAALKSGAQAQAKGPQRLAARLFTMHKSKSASVITGGCGEKAPAQGEPLVDPHLQRELSDWLREVDAGESASPFLKRVLREDVMPCLAFDGSEEVC